MEATVRKSFEKNGRSQDNHLAVTLVSRQIFRFSIEWFFVTLSHSTPHSHASTSNVKTKQDVNLPHETEIYHGAWARGLGTRCLVPMA
jgi:hypothetical protein